MAVSTATTICSSRPSTPSKRRARRRSERLRRLISVVTFLNREARSDVGAGLQLAGTSAVEVDRSIMPLKPTAISSAFPRRLPKVGVWVQANSHTAEGVDLAQSAIVISGRGRRNRVLPCPQELESEYELVDKQHGRN
jgi:hypothetical protein